MKKVEYFVDGDPSILETGVAATINQKSVVEYDGVRIESGIIEPGYKRKPLNLKDAEGWLVDLDGVFMVRESFLTPDAFVKYARKYRKSTKPALDLLKLNIGKAAIKNADEVTPLHDYLAANRKIPPNDLSTDQLIKWREDEIKNAENNLISSYHILDIVPLTEAEKEALFG